MQEAQGSIYGQVITQSCMLHGIAKKKKKKKKPNKITILICNPTLEPSDREFKITSINRIKALTEKLQCGEQVSNFSRVIVDTQNNQVEILELKNK